MQILECAQHGRMPSIDCPLCANKHAHKETKAVGRQTRSRTEVIVHISLEIATVGGEKAPVDAH